MQRTVLHHDIWINEVILKEDNLAGMYDMQYMKANTLKV